MSTKLWRGDAPAVAQVTRVTPAAVQIGDIFTVTINGKSISVTATVATAASVCTLLAAAIAASTIVEFSEFIVTNEGDTLLLTAATAGVPFVITASDTNASTLGVTITETVAGVTPVNMKQRFSIPLTASGSFTITFGDQITAAIAEDAAAATVQSALEALSTIGAGQVNVTRTTGTNDYVYTVEFTGTLAGLDCATMIITLTSEAPIVKTTQEGAHSGTPQNEIQTVNIGAVFGGETYTLTLSGQTTAAISTTISTTTAAVMRAQIEALSNVVSCSVTLSGTVYTIEFTGVDGEAAQAQMTASVYSGAATATHAIAVTEFVAAVVGVSEQQTVTLTGTPTGGTFTLTYSGQTTAAIAYNADAPTVDAALEALSNIGAGDVAVTGNAGGPWLVVFTGALASMAQPAMTGNGASLTGGSAETLSVAEVTASAGPNHWDTAANWISSGVPANGDDVRFEIGSSDCLYGLAQSGVTLASLHVAMTYTGKIGLSRQNEAGYIEYRTEALTIGATSILIGQGDGSGPGKVKLNTGAVQTTIEIRGSGGSSEQGIPTVSWRGSHAANDVTVLDGDFGTAPYSDQTAVIDVLIQRGGTVALKHTTLNELLAWNQSITAYDCTLSGGPLEL